MKQFQKAMCVALLMLIPSVNMLWAWEDVSHCSELPAEINSGCCCTAEPVVTNSCCGNQATEPNEQEDCGCIIETQPFSETPMHATITTVDCPNVTQVSCINENFDSVSDLKNPKRFSPEQKVHPPPTSFQALYCVSRV